MSVEQIEAFVDKYTPYSTKITPDHPQDISRSSFALVKTSKRREYDALLGEFEKNMTSANARLEELRCHRYGLQSRLLCCQRVVEAQREDLIGILRGRTIASMGATLDSIAKTAGVNRYIDSIGTELTDEFVLRIHGPATVEESMLVNLKSVLSLFVSETEVNDLIATLGLDGCTMEKEVQDLITKPIRPYHMIINFHNGRPGIWKRFKEDKHRVIVNLCAFAIKDALEAIYEIVDDLDQHVLAIEKVRYHAKSYELIARAMLSSK